MKVSSLGQRFVVLKKRAEHVFVSFSLNNGIIKLPYFFFTWSKIRYGRISWFPSGEQHINHLQHNVRLITSANGGNKVTATPIARLNW